MSRRDSAPFGQAGAKALSRHRNAAGLITSEPAAAALARCIQEHAPGYLEGRAASPLLSRPTSQQGDLHLQTDYSVSQRAALLWPRAREHPATPAGALGARSER